MIVLQESFSIAVAGVVLAAAGLCFLMTLGGSLAPSLRALRVDAITAKLAE
jgi:hypothetical protein